MKDKKRYEGQEEPLQDIDSQKEQDADSLTDQDVDVEDVAASDGEENQLDNLEAEILRLNSELEKQKAETEKEKKEYLFLMADFDNFRKQSLKQKSELIKNAGEQAFKGLLPILDDFERGIEASKSTDNVDSVIEGMTMIYGKLKKYLEQNGVKEFPADDTDFDADRHEAISVIPVTDDGQKGKILNTVEKGYTINDKVLRHAKVVVGQ